MKKLVSLFLTVVMAGSLCTFSFASPSNWAINDVNTAKGLGIYNSTFEDNFQKPITRAEFCSLAVKTLDKWEKEFYRKNKKICDLIVEKTEQEKQEEQEINNLLG